MKRSNKVSKGKAIMSKSIHDTYLEAIEAEGFEPSDEELYRVVMATMALLEAKLRFAHDRQGTENAVNDALLQVYELIWDIRDEEVLNERFVQVMNDSGLGNKKMARVLGTSPKNVRNLKRRKIYPNETATYRLADYYNNDYKDYSSMEAFLFDVD